MNNNDDKQVMASSGRPLEVMEQYFFLMDKNAPSNFSFAVELSGRRSAEDWLRALRKLGEIHPHLSSRIVEADDGVLYFEPESSEIPLRRIDTLDSGAWQVELAKELESPFDTSRAPLARVVLLSAKETEALIFTTHHSIGDGYSVVYAIRDLLSILAGNGLSARGVRDISTLEKLKRLEGTPELPNPPAPSSRPIRYRHRDGALPTVRRMEFSPELTAQILRRSRQEQTTVHAAISVALATAGASALPDWAEHGVRVFSPISIRQELWQDERFAVSQAPGLIEINASEDMRFWDLVRMAERLLAPQRSLATVNAKLNGMGRLLSRRLSAQELGQAVARSAPYDLMVSNLGRLPIETNIGDLRIKKMWGPAYLGGWDNAHGVSIITVDAVLRLLYVSHSPIHDLLEQTKAVLSETVGFSS